MPAPNIHVNIILKVPHPTTMEPTDLTTVVIWIKIPEDYVTTHVTQLHRRKKLFHNVFVYFVTHCHLVRNAQTFPLIPLNLLHVFEVKIVNNRFTGMPT